MRLQRSGLRAALIFGLVVLAHALVLGGVVSDLEQWVVDDQSASRLAMVHFVSPAPQVAAGAPQGLPKQARPSAPRTVSAPPPDMPRQEEPPPAPHREPDEALSGPREVLTPEPQAASPSLLPLPPEGRLVYHLTHSAYPGTTARTVVEWSTDAEAGRYELNLAAAVAGIALVRSRSIGRIDATGFHPERYTQRTTTRSESAVNFDWPGAKVTYSASRSQDALAPGMQDPLSVQFQVPLLAQLDVAKLRPGAVLALAVARPSKIDRVDFQIRGEESVTTTAGQAVAAVRLEAPRQGGADQGWEFWLAPELYWLPVRVRLVDRRGNVWDNVLASLPGTPEPPPPAPPQDPYHGA